jgi:hypothetical protein
LPDLFSDLRISVLEEDYTRAGELGVQLAASAEDLEAARAALTRLSSMEADTPGEDLTVAQRQALDSGLTAFLNAWCAPRVGDRPLDALGLVEHAHDLEVRPSPPVQRQLAESIVTRDKVPLSGLKLMLTWLAEVAASEQLPAAIQARLVDIACDPANTEVRNAAQECLPAGRQLERQGREALVRWLRELPRHHWPVELIERFPYDLAEAWRRLAEDLRTACDACLLGSESRCVRDIRPRPTAFVGHPYAAKIRSPLRTAISDSLAAAAGLEVVYADQVQKDGALSCKICQEIRSARIALFDLTPECRKAFRRFCSRAKANPNVALELGLAYAYGKPAVLFAKAGCKPPVDLVGQEIEYFTAYPDLSAKLSARVRGLT